MKSKFFLLLVLLLGLSLAAGPALAAKPEAKFIDAATLKDMLGAPDVVIIDVSKGWWTYKQKIVGSLVYPGETSTWAPQIPKDKKIVVYCG